MTEPSDLRFRNGDPRIHPTADLKQCRLGRFCSVGPRSILRDVAFGDFTYCEPDVEAIYATVGKFCSIARHVRINALEHPLERLTTHKISYRPNEYFRFLGVDDTFRERRRSRRVEVGHDVWIGHGAVILPGISLGNGAVVGANAVVTRDIPPFTISAGIPARRLRDRFPMEVAARINRLAWWDWPLDRLADALPDMQMLPIDVFLDRWEARGSADWSAGTAS